MNSLRESLSAAVFVGDSLWVASDEATSVERLTTHDGVNFADHQSFSLDELLSLPAHDTGFDQEIDIEGMEIADSFLWLIGSHSIKRKNVDKLVAGEEAKLIKKLAKTEVDGNRFFLARLPLVEANDGPPIIVANDAGSGRVAVRLSGDSRSSALTDALRATNGDPHLAKFLDMPGKDNGFDIEGLAVVGDRVFLGLRGPVLRSWAVVLELLLDTSDPSTLRLKNFQGDERPYRKHFLQLGGLGVRDLCVSGENLLVLAGPTMVLDGPVRIYRWLDALHSTGDTIVGRDRLPVIFEVPSGDGVDHAEGMAVVPGAHAQVLLVYDNPSEARKVGPAAVHADVIDLT
ncbi:MAG TPA: DUF3616 domain-containing protein [Pyrinomonadaceae bacterium]